MKVLPLIVGAGLAVNAFAQVEVECRSECGTLYDLCKNMADHITTVTWNDTSGNGSLPLVEIENEEDCAVEFEYVHAGDDFETEAYIDQYNVNSRVASGTWQRGEGEAGDFELTFALDGKSANGWWSFSETPERKFYYGLR